MTTVRRATRPAEHRLLGGVSAGLAEHLGIPVLWVRVGFVVATWFNGVGVLAYLLFWRLLPLAEPRRVDGLESASRAGRRSGESRIASSEVLQTLALVALGLGVCVLLALGGAGVDAPLLLPLLIGVAGVALVWRQLDDAAWRRWVRGTSGWASFSRILAGVALIALAAVAFVTQERGWDATLDLLSATAVAVLGLVLILGPWIVRLLGDLDTERRERVRSQERADVAAHLHDSVLQTLALLQRNADDPATVSTLARRQERDLRAWLYGDERRDGDTLVATLTAAAAEVEEMHRVPVELVSVGDADLDDDLAALVRATREAMINAAKHAAVDRIDVYVEVAGAHAAVYVRDRGIGFDPAVVADDRMGVSGSIVGRMTRYGGEAEVRSAPGEGTEVRLTMPVATSEETS